MKTFKTLFLSITFSLISHISIQAQIEFDVPPDYELKTKEDYAKYEQAVVDAAKWLEATDLDKQLYKRKQVDAFVIKWVEGSPTVTIDITEKLAKIYGDNLELLGLYMASYSSNYIEKKDAATKFTAAKAGIISMMNVYKKGIDIKKSKEMEKIIKLNNENKLDDYIKSNFK